MPPHTQKGPWWVARLKFQNRLQNFKILEGDLEYFESFEQCQVVVFIADDLGFLGPGSPDLMTELCPPQDAA